MIEVRVKVCSGFLAHNVSIWYSSNTYWSLLSICISSGIPSSDDHNVFRIGWNVMLWEDRLPWRGHKVVIIRSFIASINCVKQLDRLISVSRGCCIQKSSSNGQETLVWGDLNSRASILRHTYILACWSDLQLVWPSKSPIKGDSWCLINNISPGHIFKDGIQRGWSNIPVPQVKVSIWVHISQTWSYAICITCGENCKRNV